jgi:hypothetical protein
MFRTLNEILALLLADILGRHNDDITKRLDSIDRDVKANTGSLASVSADLAAIKLFIGMEGVPAVVTDTQIAETMAKLQAVRTSIGNFNP